MALEFAKIPGLTKILTAPDLKQYLLGCEELPDYRKADYCSYYVTEDAQAKTGKLYYEKVDSAKGGYVYKVASHTECTLDEHIGAKCEYEFGNLKTIGTYIGGKYTGLNTKLYPSHTYYYYHPINKQPTRLDVSWNGATLRATVINASEDWTEITDLTVAPDPSKTYVEYNDKTDEETYVTGLTSFKESGYSYYLITYTPVSYTFDFITQYTQVITRDILQRCHGFLGEYSDDLTLFSVDEDAGKVSQLSVASGDRISDMVYTATTDEQFDANKSYYVLDGSVWNDMFENYIVIDKTTYATGQSISNWLALHPAYDAVYEKTGAVYIQTPDFIGSKTMDHTWYERAGTRFPYVGFYAVTTESKTDQPRGALYKCTQKEYQLTEDEFHHYRCDDGVNEVSKVYYEFDESTGTYTGRDGSDENKLYRRPTGATFFQPPEEKNFLSGSGRYFTDVNGTHPLVDYKEGDSISEYEASNNVTVYTPFRTFYWRQNWKFTPITFVTEFDSTYNSRSNIKLFGTTTDTVFQSDKSYYAYCPDDSTDYNTVFSEIRQSQRFERVEDTTFGYFVTPDTTFVDGKTYYKWNDIDNTTEVYNPAAAAEEDDADTTVISTNPHELGLLEPFASEPTYYVVDSDNDTNSVYSQRFTKFELEIWATVHEGHFVEGSSYRMHVLTSDGVDKGRTNLVAGTDYEIGDELTDWSTTEASTLSSTYGTTVTVSIEHLQTDYHGKSVANTQSITYYRTQEMIDASNTTYMGGVPTEIPTFTPMHNYGTDEEPVWDGITRAEDFDLYLRSLNGEALLPDEYYEACYGMYVWERYFVDRNISTTSVSNVTALWMYDDTTNTIQTNLKLALKWKDPSFMLDADDTTKTPDAWTRTIVTLCSNDNSQRFQILNEVAEPNQYEDTFFTMDAASAHTVTGTSIDSTALHSCLSTGYLEFNCTGATGRSSTYKIRPSQLVWSHTYKYVQPMGATFTLTDPTTGKSINVSNVAVPGVKYYGSDGKQITGVVPYVTTITGDTGIYVKPDIDIPIYKLSYSKYIPYMLNRNGDEIEAREFGTNSKLGDSNNHITSGANCYYKVPNSPEITVQELIQSGMFCELFGDGDEFAIGRIIGQPVTDGNDVTILDTDSVDIAQDIEPSYRPVSVGDVSTALAYYASTTTSSTGEAMTGLAPKRWFRPYRISQYTTSADDESRVNTSSGTYFDMVEVNAGEIAEAGDQYLFEINPGKAHYQYYTRIGDKNTPESFTPFVFDESDTDSEIDQLRKYDGTLYIQSTDSRTEGKTYVEVSKHRHNATFAITTLVQPACAYTNNADPIQWKTSLLRANLEYFKDPMFTQIDSYTSTTATTASTSDELCYQQAKDIVYNQMKYVVNKTYDNVDRSSATLSVDKYWIPSITQLGIDLTIGYTNTTKEIPVYETDENGEYKLDADGQPIAKVDEDGNPVTTTETTSEPIMHPYEGTALKMYNTLYLNRVSGNTYMGSGTNSNYRTMDDVRAAVLKMYLSAATKGRPCRWWTRTTVPPYTASEDETWIYTDPTMFIINMSGKLEAYSNDPTVLDSAMYATVCFTIA